MKPQNSGKIDPTANSFKKSSRHLEHEVGLRETRKLSAQRRRVRSEWVGFGVFGLIGWSVVVPTLVGAALGRWLDQSGSGGGRSWTLTLLLAGLTLGCLNAWRWVAREHSAIRTEQEEEASHEQ